MLFNGGFQMDCISDFYNCMTSHFFAPYIMQPTRLMSKTLIDNIFINSIDYISFSGNITIQLSDHLQVEVPQNTAEIYIGCIFLS